MQNDEKRQKPTLNEFVKMMEAFRRRMPRSRFQSSDEYIASLMDTALRIDSPDGKDLVVVILGALAFVSMRQVEESDTYMGMIRTEMEMRSLYDKDYESMVEFLKMLLQRAKLADMSKAELAKSITSDILKRHFKEDSSGQPAPLAVREQPAEGGAPDSDTSAQSQTDSLG